MKLESGPSRLQAVRVPCFDNKVGDGAVPCVLRSFVTKEHKAPIRRYKKVGLLKNRNIALRKRAARMA